MTRKGEDEGQCCRMKSTVSKVLSVDLALLRDLEKRTFRVAITCLEIICRRERKGLTNCHDEERIPLQRRRCDETRIMRTSSAIWRSYRIFLILFLPSTVWKSSLRDKQQCLADLEGIRQAPWEQSSVTHDDGKEYFYR
jgi:hypothetical protein